METVESVFVGLSGKLQHTLWSWAAGTFPAPQEEVWKQRSYQKCSVVLVSFLRMWYKKILSKYSSCRFLFQSCGASRLRGALKNGDSSKRTTGFKKWFCPAIRSQYLQSASSPLNSTLQIYVKKALFLAFNNTARLSSSVEDCLNERQQKQSSAQERGQEQLFSVCSQHLFVLEQINLSLHYIWR